MQATVSFFQMGYFITVFFARSSLYVGKYKSRLNYFRLL